MIRADTKIYETNKKITELENQNSEEMTDEQLELYQELTSSVEYDEYDEYLIESKKILKGLGIEDYTTLVSTYSGGWRMRLAIAKSLISKPDVLIMDEPTNHLDLNAVIWLSKYLSKYNKTLIITSHQIDFINQFSSVIWYIGAPDIRLPKLYAVNGSYDNLMRTLNDINKTSTIAYEKLQKEIQKMKKGKKQKSGTDIKSYVEKADIPRPSKPYEVKIGFPPISNVRSKFLNIRFDNVSFYYDEKKTIFKNFDFGISFDDRIVIVGPNGIGKTTLFKLCMEMIKPIEGNIIIDSRIRIGYYNQQVIESLPLNLTPIEYLKSLDDKLDIQQCRTLLGRIGLKKSEDTDPCVIQIESLSGGQKARISFCAIQIKNPHIILFDEPTNHLDIESIQGLIDGINEFQGGIIMITHDVYLINNIKDIRIYELANQKLIQLNDGIDEYIDRFDID